MNVGDKVKIISSGNSNLLGKTGVIDSVALDLDMFGQRQYVIVFKDGCFIVKSQGDLKVIK